ncbi:hypothetical protein AB0J82_38720, partial [Asanoa sp. NPDC049518]|uniref:hypothetical protein n=1 Tax=Asanoa sp. NPDC049518 TaxID=3155503 RepID=UPI0034141145
YIVDTAAGKVVRELEPERDERVVVVGGRVLRASLGWTTPHRVSALLRSLAWPGAAVGPAGPPVCGP